MPAPFRTKSQLKAIHAKTNAIRSGVSKRELFEADVQRIKLAREEGRDEGVTPLFDLAANLRNISDERALEKASVIIALQRDKEARESFIKENALRRNQQRSFT